MRCTALKRKRTFVISFLFPIAVCLLAASPDVAIAVEGRIAFTSQRDGDEERAVYIMDPDGGNPSKLTEGSMPAWLPDGKRIGFAHHGDIWIIDSDGTNRVNVTKGRFKESPLFPAWSPDGRNIAYMSIVGGIFGVRDIFLMSANARHAKNLTDDFNHDGRPSWSPYGRKIAFSSVFVGGANDFGGDKWLGSDIFVMDANGRNRVNLTQNGRAENFYAGWSPDGSRIAYSASPKPGQWFPPSNIYVMNADGSNPILLTPQERWANEASPCWSPDSTKIAFVNRTPDSFTDIFTINADGSDLRNITQTHRVTERYPAWSPPPWAVSASGRLVTQWGDLKQGAKPLQRIESED